MPLHETSISDLLMRLSPTPVVLAVRLGVDYDIPTILPAAMYELCVLYELYDHTRTEVLGHWSIQAGEWPAHMRNPLDLSKLDAGEFKQLWLGRGALRACWIRRLQDNRLAFSVKSDLENWCESDAVACARSFDKEWRLFQVTRNPAIDPDPFSCLQAIRENVQSTSGLCVMCREHIIEFVLDPTELWRELRRIFNLVSYNH